MDYPAHEGTYKAFIKFGTIGTVAVITIVSLMAIFLTWLSTHRSGRLGFSFASNVAGALVTRGRRLREAS